MDKTQDKTQNIMDIENWVATTTNVTQVTICPDAKSHRMSVNVYYNTIGIGTFLVGCWQVGHDFDMRRLKFVLL